MSQYCYPCVLSEIIFPAEECKEPVEQDNQWANYLKAVVEDFIPKMKVSFGTYPKTKYFMILYQHGRHLFKFITSIHSDQEAIDIMNKKAIEYSHTVKSSLYAIIKEVNGVKEEIYRKPFKVLFRMTKKQKEFILANEGKMQPMEIAKALGLSKWTVYNFRRRRGLAKPLKYHGNRKRQETLI